MKKKPAGGSEQPVSLSGSVSPSISGATVTLTLASAVVATDSGGEGDLRGKPTTGSGNRIVDAVGNEAADFTDQAVRNTSGPLVAVSSGAGTDNTYAIGDTISLDRDVSRGGDGERDAADRVDGGHGDPARGVRVEQQHDDGAGVQRTRWSEGDADSDGIAVDANALANHGGSTIVAERGWRDGGRWTHAEVAASDEPAGGRGASGGGPRDGERD